MTKFTFTLLILCVFASTSHSSHDPTIGRWANRDPIEEGGGPNSYRMVSNDPMLQFDIFGLCGCSCNDINIQFNPGGNAFKWDLTKMPYVIPPGGTAKPDGFKMGNKIIATFSWTGPKKGCKFEHNEQGTTKAYWKSFWSDNWTPNGVTPGQPNNIYDEVDLQNEYHDHLGIYVGQVGYNRIETNIRMQFICTGSDGKKKERRVRIKGWAEARTYPPVPQKEPILLGSKVEEFSIE